MQLASLGERLLASIIDLFIILSYAYVISKFIISLGIISYGMDYWSKMAIYSLFYLPGMLYTLLSEIFLDGQTLGKKVLKIKVIKIDGYAASFGDYFSRWIFRVVDIWLMGLTPIVGIISIISSKNNQRFGDMASGTAVVSLRNRHKINHSILEETQNKYVATFPSVINLSDNDMRIIRHSFGIASKSKDYKTIDRLRIKVEEITKTTKGEMPNSIYLKTMITIYVF